MTTAGEKTDAGEHLVYMANQIARFFQSQGSVAGAAAATTEHFRNFWAPAMRREIVADLDAGRGEALSDIARAAVEKLRPAVDHSS